MQEIFWGTVSNKPAPGTVALRSTPASDEALAGIPDKYWHHFRVTFHPDLPGSQFLRNVSVFAEGCIDCGPVHVCHRERISQCTDFGVYLRGLLGDSYYHAWAITSPDRKVWKWMSSDPCTNLYVQYPDVAEMVGWDHYVWYVLHDISDPRRWHESQWYDHQGYQRLLSLCGRGNEDDRLDASFEELSVVRAHLLIEDRRLEVDAHLDEAQRPHRAGFQPRLLVAHRGKAEVEQVLGAGHVTWRREVGEPGGVVVEGCAVAQVSERCGRVEDARILE